MTEGGAVVVHRHYVYDDLGRLLEEYDVIGSAPRVIGRYFYLDSPTPCAADLPDENGVLRRHYYLEDDQASVVAVADRFGVVAERIWYDPFGQPVIEPRDETAPVIKRVLGGAGGTLLIELTEPVTGIVSDQGTQPGIRRLNPSFSDLVSQPAGETDLPEAVSGFAPYSVIVFTPDEPLSGTTTLSLAPGKLTDDWNNHVAEQSVSLNISGGVGVVYYTAGANVVTERGTVARSTIGSPFLFHGQYFDYETGLIFMRARVYDPFSAMFLQPDPAGYEDSVNLYAAFGNNPASRVDPTGTEWIQIGENEWKTVAHSIIAGESARRRPDWDVIRSARAVLSNPMLIADGSHAVNIQRGAKSHAAGVYQSLLSSGAVANPQASRAFSDISDLAMQSPSNLRRHATQSGFSMFETEKLADFQEFKDYFHEKKKAVGDKVFKVARPFARTTKAEAQRAYMRMVKNSNFGGSEIWYRFSISSSGQLRSESLRIDEWEIGRASCRERV